MIIPVNGYLLISPLKHESFVQSEHDTYDEIGEVIAVAEGIEFVKVGQLVYFDSYMAKKYSNPDDKNDFIWLVHRDEVCGVT